MQTNNKTNHYGCSIKEFECLHASTGHSITGKEKKDLLRVDNGKGHSYSQLDIAMMNGKFDLVKLICEEYKCCIEISREAEDEAEERGYDEIIRYVRKVMFPDVPILWWV
jgi:hypothetical protein